MENSKECVIIEKIIVYKKGAFIMTTLLLVRHGYSNANFEKKFAGHLNVDLHENGVKQAKKTAEYIKENYKVDKIYSSDLIRAYKTAEAIAEKFNLEIEKVKELREINAGKWDDVKYSDVEVLYEEDRKTWMNDIKNARCTGGESVKELYARIVNALTDIAKNNDNKTVVVASHGTPIRLVKPFIVDGNLDNMQDTPWPSNASVTVISYDNGNWNLIEYSHDEHLEELKTILPGNV